MRLMLWLILASVVSGCALTTEPIDIPYTPSAARAPAPGATAVTVAVSASDARTSYRDRVSSKKNGFGMEMAPIVATNDIVQTVRAAVAQELHAEGFAIGPGSLELAVEVVKFYNDFKTGVFAGDAVADVTLNLKVLRPDRSVVFAKLYTGEGKEENIQLATGENARLALIRALGNAVQNLVGDAELTAALTGDRTSRIALPAGAPAAAPAPPPAEVAAAAAPEPVMIGDGTCVYKSSGATQLSLHIENGGQYLVQPRGPGGITVLLQCRNGRLSRGRRVTPPLPLRSDASRSAHREGFCGSGLMPAS